MAQATHSLERGGEAGPPAPPPPGRNVPCGSRCSGPLVDTIDPDGVALAAIHGLHALVQERDAEIDELRSKQAAMAMQLAALTLRLEDQIASR